MAYIRRLGALFIYLFGIAFAIAYVTGALAAFGLVPPTAF